MTKTCPLCNGKGQRPRFNGVDVFARDEHETCRMCQGAGVVDEQRTEKIHIRKYWTADVVE